MPITPVPGSCVACGGEVVALDEATLAALENITANPTPSTLTSQARIVTPGSDWTPGADVTGILTGVAFNVLTGTASITDENGTVSALIPAGTSFDWNAMDANTLIGPDSVASVGGTILATWTQR